MTNETNTFLPVIELPPDYLVLDFTSGPDPRRKREGYAIGRYNEHRPGVYNTPLFKGVRDIHIGIDISAPIGTPIRAFADGKILMFNYNAEPGDYGAVVITEHDHDGRTLYALWGHLQMRSIENKTVGQSFRAGDVIAWVGDTFENGGWPNPHLHFQLSWERPLVCDMPGVVAQEDLARALEVYPDPRMVLGPLY